MQHIIKKQTIHVSVDKKLDPFQIQQRMSELYRKELLPVLEKLFNEVSNEDQILQIDSLEIDLGIISEKDWQSKRWKEAILLKLAQRCKEKLEKEACKKEKPASLQPKAIGICRQWMFYMEKGYLPWNSLGITDEWKQKVLEALAVDFSSLEAFIQLVKSNDKALIRVVEQHSEAFVLQLLEVITAREQKNISYLLDELEVLLLKVHQDKSTSGGSLMINFRTQLWPHVLRLAVAEKAKANTSLIGQYLLQQYMDNPAAVQKYVLKPKQDLPVLYPILKQWEKQVKRDQLNREKAILAKQQKDTRKNEAVDNAPLDQGLHQQEEEKEASLGEAWRNKEKGQQKKEKEISLPEPQVHQEFLKGKPGEMSKAETPDHVRESEPLVLDEEGIFVAYAGIVLLHPFLGMFFNLLGLVEEGKFKDHGAHLKALYLLHYLGTGEETAEECDLVIPKVLTAYPLAEPVEKEVFLSNEEKEEADHLLLEVIRQWDKLKNTSPDELRGGFLQRKARLFSKNEQTYLQFEAAAIDILLDYLPWNLSIIKLPWMKHFLSVEWR